MQLSDVMILYSESIRKLLENDFMCICMRIKVAFSMFFLTKKTFCAWIFMPHT
jgi:hypothetical protein